MNNENKKKEMIYAKQITPELLISLWDVSSDELFRFEVRWSVIDEEEDIKDARIEKFVHLNEREALKAALSFFLDEALSLRNVR